MKPYMVYIPQYNVQNSFTDKSDDIIGKGLNLIRVKYYLI